MKSISVKAAREELDPVMDFINSFLDAYECSARSRFQIEIAVEEIFVNIASYAYPDGEGEATVSIDVEGDPQEAVMVFSDGGKPFDPLARPDADTSPEGILGRIGGLGILMTKRTMDALSYEYRDGKNVLTIRKKLC